MTATSFPPRARHTKIIATLGPASSSPAAIRQLHDAGADVFRLNFSHGTHGEHQERLHAIRALEQEAGRPIAVLLDLQGPKLRIGAFADERVVLERGHRIRLDLDPAPGNAERVSLPHPEIFAALQPGHQLLIDDGRARFAVVSCGDDFAVIEAQSNCVLSNRKGVNVPDAVLPLSPLTEKDRRDLAFGLALGVDWIALSFVQRAEDVQELMAIVGTRAGIVAKLEKPSAIEDLERIVDSADAIMVARGDLGVEMPPELVPGLQKKIVATCRRHGKPVIVATQMLESMVSAPTPTRAEASDVATAVYDGVDAVMLSAESASGAYPVEAVSIMGRIIGSAEIDGKASTRMADYWPTRKDEPADAICAAIHTMARVLPIAATITYTSSGATTLRVAHQRPQTPILSLTPNLAVARRLALIWGVHSVCTEDARSVEEMVGQAEEVALREGFRQAGKPLVVVAGTPFGVSGSTNLLRVIWPEREAAKAGEDMACRPRDPYFNTIADCH
ncbi:pyruvate kinase [Noviherbaspirillum galbum]|uniref:Pyruvate kinase n=1 Tax=Noviherbaspirillum galbum TaxID=2709383 RepID=A0A6B3ST02_9BURK|nr:pyruvate kinase [Noviherbaspirillum galbum]NEX61966.1 pyruvate kinase [Noviherbaspirillum galbum]